MGLPPFSRYRVCLRHLIVAGSYGQKYNIFWLFVVYEMLRNIPFFACLRHGPRGILLLHCILIRNVLYNRQHDLPGSPVPGEKTRPFRSAERALVERILGLKRGPDEMER